MSTKVTFQLRMRFRRSLVRRCIYGLHSWTYSAAAAEQNLKYLYGRQYGWAKQFRIKGKPVVALFPNEGYFVALIILNQDQLLAASQLRLHKNAIRAMDAANLYREGKWLFMRVEKLNDLKDIEALLKLKEG